jgi:hypothetical protein
LGQDGGRRSSSSSKALDVSGIGGLKGFLRAPDLCLCDAMTGAADHDEYRGVMAVPDLALLARGAFGEALAFFEGISMVLR